MDSMSVSPPLSGSSFPIGLDSYSCASHVGTTSTSTSIKPKQSKSRNGCVTCKAKRLKCDETKPTCQQCQKRGVPCGGYKKDFKWRPFEESSIANRVAKPIRRGGTKKKIPTSPRSAPTPKSLGLQDSSSSLRLFSPEMIVSSTPLYLPTPSETSEYTIGNSPESPHTIGFSDETSITNSMPSPHMRDLLAAPETSIDFLNIPRTSAETYGLHRSSTPPLMALDPQEVDGEVVREDTQGASWGLVSWPADDLGNQMVLSDLPEHFAFVSAFDIFNRPHFLPSSTEMIRSYFDKNTCGIMSVKDGPTENPWRMELWPMAQDSLALLHAISAMTAFHMSLEYPFMRDEGREHQRKSLRFLNQGFSHTNIKDDAALATTLVLAFADAFDSPMSAGTVHLRGGRGLIYKVLERQDWLNGNQIFMRRFKFLYNVWVYLDVLARLTSDVDNDVQSPIFHGPLESSPEVDPLLGCADTLFPLIRRAASIGHRVRGCKRNTVLIVSEAADLQKQLKEWTPPYTDYEPIQDSSSNVSHCIQTAEAYRTATLLHLHQAVPELPSPGSHDLANEVMIILASIPASSRSCITHIYPLFAAGCEASGEEERDWVSRRWASMEHRLRIGNVQTAVEVTREVWKRRDKFIFGKKGSPLRHNLQHSSPPMELPPSSSQDTLEWEHSTNHARQWSPGSPFSDCSTGRFGLDALQDGELEYELSVRGRLHWAHVMADLGYEVLLG